MQKFVTPNPDFKTRTRDIFDGMNFMRVLGVKIDEIGPGFCQLSMPFSEEFTQQDGYFHAGVLATLADNSAGLAGTTLLPADTDILTVEYKMNILRPGKGELVFARGEVIKPGKTLCVAKSDVFTKTAGKTVQCCTALVTLMYLSK